MSAPQLTELRSLLAHRSIALVETRAPRHGLSIRKRLQKKYESRLPEFRSYHHEIEWRLREVNARMGATKHEKTVGWESIAYHWCRVAILAGYQVEHGYLQRKDEKSPLCLSATMLKIWEECFEKLIFDYATFLHPELQPKPKLNRYAYFDSYGKQSVVEAENVCDFATKIFDTGLTCDEQKRCLSMLSAMKIYQHRLSGLMIRIMGNQIIVSLRKKEQLFEVIAIEQTPKEKAEAC